MSNYIYNKNPIYMQNSNRDPQISSKQQQAAIKIQKWFRGYQCRIDLKQRIRHFRQRQKLVIQLMQSQEKYIRDLSIITSDFKNKLISEKVITEADAKVIFKNIDEIRQLNELSYAYIFNDFQKYWHYQIIFKDTYKKVPFFKLYFDYFNNYDNSRALVEKLMKNNLKFRSFIQAQTKNSKYQGLSFEDYLIKPVQRLPKYVLIFKEIIKKTIPQHPDYQNCTKLLQAFQIVNRSNNEKLNKVYNDFKLNEIAETLTLEDVAVPQVQFVSQEPVTILTDDHKTMEATLLLLNNQIIAKKARNDKFIARIWISHGASVIDDQDQCFYRNTITIQSIQGDSLTILCSSTNDKTAMFQKLLCLVCKAQKKSTQKAHLLLQNKVASDSFLKKLYILELMPEVTILGTAQRQARFLKYTVYIIEIKIKNVRQKIFLRFSQILAINGFIKVNFPNLQLKQNLLTSTWLMNHKPKTIEQRKMSIQRFLKEVLSKSEIIENGQILLFKMGLPFDFYDLPTKFTRTDDLHKSITNHKKSKIKKISHYRISVFEELKEQDNSQEQQSSQSFEQISRINLNDLLKANEAHLGHYTRFSEKINPFDMEMQMVHLTIFVPFLQQIQGFKIIKISVEGHHRIQFLISKLAKQLQLQYYKDFRLFLQRDFYQRVLDDDEQIHKVKQEEILGGHRIILKKMIYIDLNMEIKEIRNDNMRMKLVASQMIYQISRGKYLLTYQNYLMFCVMTGIVIQSYYNIPIKDLTSKTKERVIPKFSQVSNKQMWDKDYVYLFEKFKDKVQSIVRQKKRTICEKSYIQSQVYSLHAYFMIIHEISKNPLFGAYLFMVQLNQDMINYLTKQKNIQCENRNCWLAVKQNMVQVYCISLKKILFTFKEIETKKIETNPACIIMFLKNGQQIKFKTTQSYFIRQLILYYKNYESMWQKMIKDPVFHQSFLEACKQRTEIQTQFTFEQIKD